MKPVRAVSKPPYTLNPSQELDKLNNHRKPRTMTIIAAVTDSREATTHWSRPSRKPSN